MRYALLLMLLLLAPASAQTIIDLEVSINPEEMTVDPRKHIQRPGQPAERQFFDVHIRGTIQCQLLSEPPLGFPVNVSGPTEFKDQQENITYFSIEPKDFAVFWTDAGGDSYTVDHRERITVIADGAPPGDVYEQTLQWFAGTQEPRGTPRCDPQGYRAFGTGNNTVFVPGTGDGDPGIDETPNETTPIGPLAIVAVGLAAWRSRRHG